MSSCVLVDHHIPFLKWEKLVNVITIKDLIKDLYGTNLFSKLDLHSDYHQARMHLKDMHKKAFHKHQGHYELDF